MSGGGGSEKKPGSVTPQALHDAWLKFHEKELCQDLDTVFAFYPRGVEVWCLLEDDRSFQRLAEMLQPLKASFEVDVYTTRPMPEKKSTEEKDPPPSLWNNVELQTNLEGYREVWPRGDAERGTASPPRNGRAGESERQTALKQRLIMWTAQILGWRKKVQRYAADLPELAHLGFGPGADSKLRARAVSACLAHAQSLDRNLARLIEGLSQAFPRPEKGARRVPEAAEAAAPASPEEIAVRISTETLALAARIHRFLYPQDFTVGLTDLRDPSLLEALRKVRKEIWRLQKEAGGSRR